MSGPPRRLATALLALTLLTPAGALANGNVSHIWVTLWARDHLPAGELRDILEREDVILRNGANFPDGGYAVNDGYGEIAHWEPFQSAYLDWIVENFEPPWTDEAGRHIAFLMGMASHGMCDQLYDCQYLRRGTRYDEGSPGSSIGMDGSTDVCLAAEAGPLDPPEYWVPDELMAELMLAQAGHEVDATTIADGHALVAFSVYFVSEVSQDPEQVEEHRLAYPWSCDHQMDPDVPGSPPVAAPVVAVYMQRLWDRLHGLDPLDEPLMASYPEPLTLGHPHDATDLESVVSFVISRAMDTTTVTGDTVRVTDGEGLSRPVQFDLCYGSHVVNLHPEDGWAPVGRHQVDLDGIQAWDGGAFVPASFEFTTATAPEEEPEGCDCRIGSGARSSGVAMALAAAAVAVRRRWRRP